jgi:hypothetical protein
VDIFSQFIETYTIDEQDTNYSDPLGRAPNRPKTAAKRSAAYDETFENDQVDDDLLPE